MENYMIESGQIREIIASADKLQNEWSRKWFWRQRLPRFAETRVQVRKCIFSRLEHGKAGQSYFGLMNDSKLISLDAFVLQVMVLAERGFDFGLKTTYHPAETEWMNDSPKHDNWET